MAPPFAPTADDLAARLYAANLVDGATAATLSAQQAAVNLSVAVAAAIEDWEADTGWHPFIAQEQVRVYDPQGPEKGPVGIYLGLNNLGGSRFLFLRSGILSVRTLIASISLTNPAGTVLTQGTDFFLRPRGAADWGWPYTYIEFRVPQYGNPESISIDGVFGFAAEWPNRAWEAVLDKAFLRAAPELAVLKRGLIQEWKSGTTEEQYFEKAFTETLSLVQSRYDDTRRYYQRKEQALG
ncbi:MAG TPA: hypothetical protein VKT32_10620 [Chthonomonadaceae bacterium]|nr:hypothetical protein [Chthonomonadaceae bacterium]